MLSMNSQAHISGRIWPTSVLLCVTLLLAGCGSPQDADPFVRNCRTYCQFDISCNGGPDNTFVCVDACEDSLELDAVDYGPDCESAFKAAMACLAQMTCAEFHQFQTTTAGHGPCPEALLHFYDLCPGVYFAPPRDPQ